MPITILAGPFTVYPIQDLGYTARRASRSVIHEVIGRADPVVTLRPVGLRTGTLDLLFKTVEEAVYCADAHSQGTVCRYLDTDLPSAKMRYVVNGSITREVDTETYLWLVHVDFQEVAP